VILSKVHPGRTPPRSQPPRGGHSTTLDLIEGLYRRAPHATLYTPLCKIRDVLRGCHYLVSTDGERLSAVVAYTDDAIEATWALPGRAEILRNLIAQVQRRLEALSFLPVMETGRRSWSQMLGLQVLGRYFRARHVAPLPGPPTIPAGFRLVTVDVAKDLPAVVRLMNMAYPSLPDFVDMRDVEGMTSAPYHFPDGWFFLREETHRHPVGMAVNGYCPDSDEGFIDWIQVLPRYRRHGLGSLLVTESIRRLAAASFITVSGSLDAPFAVGDLYRKCGFGQTRQWTILGKQASSRRAPATPRGGVRPPKAS